MEQFFPETVYSYYFRALAGHSSFGHRSVKFQCATKKELSAINLPVEVETTLSLQPADKTAVNMNTDGVAYVLQQGEERRLVVQIQNLPTLKESEVYQVWLLNKGERANAGTFKPDEAGTGLLTYKLILNDQFNQIGITKEPDPNGTQPRGKKIVGSS